MNEERTIEILTNIEYEQARLRGGDNDAVGFDMNVWYSAACGTVACLAGHAAMSVGYIPLAGMDMFRDGRTGDYRDVEEIGCEVLGLTAAEGSSLFYLPDLDAVYEWVANRLGLDEQVLRDKVRR